MYVAGWFKQVLYNTLKVLFQKRPEGELRGVVFRELIEVLETRREWVNL